MIRPLTKRLTELETLSRSELQARWQRAFGRPAPNRASHDLLQRALAYDLQQQAEGGLSKAALRRLTRLAGPSGNGSGPPRPAPPRPRPGTRFIREWRGEVHQVTVLDAGFGYRGENYASLSQIAREITGTRWSGPLFFGLRKAVRPEASTDGR